MVRQLLLPSPLVQHPWETGRGENVCLSVCLSVNTDSQMNSVPGLGVGSFSRPLPASEGSTRADRSLLNVLEEGLLVCCGAVSPGWLGEEQRADKRDILLQRKQTTPLSKLSFPSPPNCLRSSQRPFP